MYFLVHVTDAVAVFSIYACKFMLDATAYIAILNWRFSSSQVAAGLNLVRQESNPLDQTHQNYLLCHYLLSGGEETIANA